MADQGQTAELLWSSDLMLELLGPVRLGNSAGDDLTPKARKTRALLALLAMSKSPLPRARLTDLLWGDRGDEQAKASLRQAIYELRALANGGYVSAGRESIALGPKKLATDLSRIQQLVDQKDTSAVADALESVECPLLGTLDDLTPELDEWLRDERSRVGSALVADVGRIAADALEQGNTAVARRLADQLERLDPTDERAAQIGIRADLAQGDRAAAVRRRARFATRLEDQLGIAPSAETEALLGATQSTTMPEAIAGQPQRHAKPRLVKRNRLLAAAIVVALIAAAALVYTLLQGAPVDATPTVAVLPFDDLGQKNQDYFASGVSDEILNLLARQNSIRVLGRVSAAQLAAPRDSLATARALGVTYLLDGSVRTAGPRVLVIARLTRVSDGAQVWSERYERRAGDIFAVQGEIAGSVASRVAQSFSGAKPQETTPEVYDRYLSARQLARERRDVTLKEAERLLREAIGLDPRYAPAYAELAQVIMLRTDHPTSYGFIPYAQGRAEAEPFARKAIALDPGLGDGYAALGFLSLSLDRRAEPYLRKAVELSPQRADFHRWHAETLMATDRYDDAIAEYKRAVEIDPLWGLNYDHLIGALFRVGRNAEAQGYAKRFLTLSTDQRAKLLVLRSVQGDENQYAAELKTTRALERAYPGERQMSLNLAETLAVLGQSREAERLIPYDKRGVAALSSDWSVLARTAEAEGPQFWDRSGYWNTAALLVASGHSASLVRLYDEIKPKAERGEIDADKIAVPEAIVALRKVGRAAEADRLLQLFRRHKEQLPAGGFTGEEKAIGGAIIAALTGDRETAIRTLDQWSRAKPFMLLPLPAMALRYDPVFASLTSDPRFPAIEDRIRVAVNAERARAGLPPINREAWISDPISLLTKN